MASPWAAKRQFAYIAGILGFFVLVVGIPSFIYFYKPPTCSDGKQNHGEEGVDCGGPCTNLCPTGFVRPTILFSRYSKVADGLYNLLAYVDNPNMLGGTVNTKYVFRLYDKDSLLIGERSGTVSISPGRKVAIFEPSFQSVREPKNIIFEFDSNLRWVRPGDEPVFKVSDIAVDNDGFYSRINAQISNQSEKAAQNVEVIAIVYDSEDNATAFSRTYIDAIPGLDSSSVSFIWPEKFTEIPTKIDIVARTL